MFNIRVGIHCHMYGGEVRRSTEDLLLPQNQYELWLPGAGDTEASIRGIKYYSDGQSIAPCLLSAYIRGTRKLNE